MLLREKLEYRERDGSDKRTRRANQREVEAADGECRKRRAENIENSEIKRNADQTNLNMNAQ